MSMAERLSHILMSGKVTSARLIERSDGDTIAEIKAPSALGGNSLVIECSSQFNFLPTRVSSILDDGRLSAFTELEYQQVRSDPTPIWFLKSAVRRSPFPDKNTSPDNKQWRQVITTTVHSLETDVLPPPPRDEPDTLPAGTNVQDLIPRPPPPPAPVPAIFSDTRVIVGVILTLLILLTVLYLWISKLRVPES